MIDFKKIKNDNKNRQGTLINKGLFAIEFYCIVEAKRLGLISSFPLTIFYTKFKNLKGGKK